jgi:predicted helicase
MPCVKMAADFWVFSKAGRALADLHVNFETVAMHPVGFELGRKRLADLSDAQHRVEKMRYGKNSRGQSGDKGSSSDAENGKSSSKGEKDLTTLIYNAHITLTGIPLAAYDYVANGKPALDWVVERQCVKTDKDSGIVNDANLWATETMGNARYPLELFQRVITVSLETMKIVRALPALQV